MLRTALIRGAFDYQGQKCSAASRAFVARSVWRRMGDDFLSATADLSYGDVTDLTNFGGAVIDSRAYAKNADAIERAKGAAGVTVAVGGEYDDSVGYFVRPTVLLSDDPTYEAFSTEYFGPILAVHVYPDERFDDVLDIVDSGSKYALTVRSSPMIGLPCRPSRADCVLLRAISTSTTNRRVPSSDNSPLGVRAPPVPTTKPVRRRICCAGPRRARSKRHSFPVDHTYPHMKEG